MGFRKPPPSIIEAFERALPADPRVEPRKMFGMPCAFASGNLFFGTFEDTLTLRLGEADRAAVIAAGGKQFEPMEGRPMREYVQLPDETVADARELARWVQRGLDYALSLPRKEKKAPAKKKPAAAAKKMPAAAAAKTPAVAKAKKMPAAAAKTPAVAKKMPAAAKTKTKTPAAAKTKTPAAAAAKTKSAATAEKSTAKTKKPPARA